MRISILCSDAAHPVNRHLERWVARHRGAHEIALARRKSELPGGDLLFLVSCSEIVRASDRAPYGAALVLHASDLPRGRGWSPHIWELLGGAGTLTLSLIEAAEPVDSGRIWKKLRLDVPRDALWDEINECLFEAEFALMDFAVENFGCVHPEEQSHADEATYWPRRTPTDSRLDPQASIASQFDRIRVCDPVRYPAYFDLRGHRYKLVLEKVKHEPD